jgi:opine dehydrogenase
MKNNLSITILGGGNAAFAVAADLTLKGYDIRLLEIPELSANILKAKKIGGIELINNNVPGIESGFAKINIITTNAKHALDGSNIILFLLPGYAETYFSKYILPYVNQKQIFVFFCGIFGGALEFRKLLKTTKHTHLPLIAETEALMYGAFKENPISVKVLSKKQSLALAGLPSSDTEKILQNLKQIFPDLTKAKNVIETGLRNANIILHPPVCILNASRLQSTSNPFRFYWDGVTEPVGKVMEKLDQERLQVGDAIGLTLPSTKNRLIYWYGKQGASGETLGEVVSTNPVYKNVMSPKTLNHRFITEDIPFGLVPIEGLGNVLNIPTPITTSLINLGNELLSTDFRKQGRNISRLGLDEITINNIHDYI